MVCRWKVRGVKREGAWSVDGRFVVCKNGRFVVCK